MKKNGIIFIIIIFVFFSSFILSCNSYRKAEDAYQSDADIIRVQHFDYYAKLLIEYFEKNGKYPFQYEKDAPVYVFIQNKEQAKNFEDTNPYVHYNVDDKYFFEELANGLAKDIDEKYDPQKVAADSRPNFYIYMVDGDEMYFSIHVYYENPFTKNIAKYYNKMELSNVDSDEYTLFTYATLNNDTNYNELINRKSAKQSYFDEIDMQLKDESKVGIQEEVM
jgi:hypothetical protein